MYLVGRFSPRTAYQVHGLLLHFTATQAVFVGGRAFYFLNFSEGETEVVIILCKWGHFGGKVISEAIFAPLSLRLPFSHYSVIIIISAFLIVRVQLLAHFPNLSYSHHFSLYTVKNSFQAGLRNSHVSSSAISQVKLWTRCRRGNYRSSKE